MEAGGLLERFAPPPGDAGHVRASAGAWRAAAQRVEALGDTAQAAVSTLAGSWDGPARDSFGSAWQQFAEGLAGGAGQLRAGADALDRAADALEEALARYWQLMAGAGAAVAVGVLLTPITLGLSDVVADGAAAGEIALLVGTLSEALGVEASVLAGLAATAARLLGTFAVQTAAAVTTDAVTGAVFFPDHDPRRHVDLRGDLEIGLAGTFAAPWRAVLTGSAARWGPEIATGAAGTASRVILDGTTFGLGSATVQLTLDGRLDPGTVAFAAVGATAGSAVARVGAHSARPAPRADGPAAAGLDQRLQRVLARSTQVPSGRSFFDGERDPWFARAVPLVPAERGSGIVFLHGSPTTVYAAGTALDAHELAALIRADPALAGRPVRLFACETGRRDDGFAHQLAQELGVEVHAPTELAWLGPSGEMYTTSGRLLDDFWVQTVPHDGQWRTFRPR